MTNEADRIEADISRSRTALNDTIEALGTRLSPGQILDEAIGLARGQAGQFASNLGKQVRDNPMPVLLIGAGIGMMLLNARKAGNHDADLSEEDHKIHASHSRLQEARAKISRTAHETEEAFIERLHEAEALALDLKRDASEAIESFKARVRSAAHAADLGAHKIRDKAKSGVSGAAHYAGDKAAALKESAADASRRAQSFYDEYPLAAGAIGLAIGAIAGSAAPLSDAERKNLKGAAEAAAKGVADMAEKGARAVERTADRAADVIH